MSAEDRSSAQNAIWLCQTCAKLIDSDASNYTEGTLQEWKRIAEASAYLEQRGFEITLARSPWRKIETQMPELLNKMRGDLKNNPVYREFYLMHKRLTYNMSGPHISYFFDSHPNLAEKIRILQNLGLVTEITPKSIPKFLMSEEFADYLLETAHSS